MSSPPDRRRVRYEQPATTLPHPPRRSRPSPRPRRSPSRALRALVAAVLVAWAAVGVYGAYRYIDDYWLYRGFGAPQDPVGVSQGRLVQASFYSRSLGEQRPYMIYLPSGYDAAARRGRRFPVLYLLHGSPGTPTSMTDAGAAGVALDRLLAAHKVKPFLLVVPDGRKNGEFVSDPEWANGELGRYEDFVMDLVHEVDGRWSTVRDRRARGLAGNSAGGYAAMNVGLHHLATFSVSEAWSGYFVQDRGSQAFAQASSEQLFENSPALYVRQLAGELRRWPLYVLLYAGQIDRERPALEAFAPRLRAAGAHVTTTLVGGGHSWRLWRREMPLALTYAGDHFVTPAVRPRGARGAARLPLACRGAAAPDALARCQAGTSLGR